MATLRLLGGARLERRGDRLQGEAAQRHRIALLAVLALAREGRLPREKILALLWPEQGPRQARHLLNVAVHVLRKALGRATVLSEGDDLRLDPALLGCDAVDFRSAVARGDLASAVELYAGPFMDGFFLDGAHDFESWQGERRKELEAAYLDALATRAAEAEESGDLSEATACLQRLVRVQPMDGLATVRLMRLLEARGDVAGALTAAEEHARVMNDEFGATPSLEVERLALRIRTDPRPSATADVPRQRNVPPTPDAPAAEAHPSRPAAPAGTPAGPALAATAPGRSHAADARTSERPRDAKRARRYGLVVAAALSAVALPLLVRGTGPDPAAPPYEASVAVLPFVDMSAGGDMTHLSDGLTEDVLNALAQTPGLKVAARSSSFQFRGEGLDLRVVGRRLAVSALVEGSVRIDGERLRVTAQLIDAESGYHIWSEQYDREIRDVFEVQEEIARAVATELSAELAARLPDTLVTAATANPAAYQLYLRGRHEWRKRTEEGMRSALTAFQEAIALDPSYAAAYAGLADTWQLLPDYAGAASAEGLARAKTAALRAVALDSTLAEAHVSLAALLDDYDRDRTGAEAAYRRAIELNPGYATARHWLAIHLADEGRFEEALEEIEHARRLDPLSAIVNTAVGAVRYFARDHDGAVAEYRSVLDVDPDFALAWALLGRVHLVTGRVDEAVAELGRAVELSDGDPSYRAVYAASLAAAGRTTEARAIADEVWSPHPAGYVPYCELASAYLWLGDEEKALTLFEHGYEARDPALKHVRVEPLYDRVRSHAGFVAVMRRAGFDEP